MTDTPEPVVCTLTTAAAARQAVEWVDLRDLALATEAVPQGAAMTFPLAVADDVADLAAREATCCAFLAITTERTADTIRLVVTSEHPDGRPVIAALAGLSPE